MEVYIAQKNAWNKEFHVYGVSFEFYVHIEYSNFNLNFNLDRARRYFSKDMSIYIVYRKSCGIKHNLCSCIFYFSVLFLCLLWSNSCNANANRYNKF